MREIDPEQCVSRHVRRCALFRIFAQWKREKTCFPVCVRYEHFRYPLQMGITDTIKE